MTTGAVWVFDLDATLVDSLTGSSLRPGSLELLTHLRDQGHTLVLWSAGGGAYARRRALQQGVADLFDAFHDKHGRDERGRYLVDRFLDNAAPAVFVDDRPEDLPVGVEVIGVSPYLAANPHDRGLDPAALRAGLLL